MNLDDYKNHVERAIEQSRLLHSKLPKEALAIKGLSSIKVRHLFNNLFDFPGCRYLEVGTYTGSSLISACYDNKNMIEAVAVDDWSMDKNAEGKLKANIEQFKNHLIPPIRHINQDAFTLDISTLGKFNAYFYDGCHSATCQEKAITHFFNCLDSIAIVVVDDYAIWRVQQGTVRGFDKMDCRRIKWALTLPGEHKDPERLDLWWGGLGIFIIQS